MLYDSADNARPFTEHPSLRELRRLDDLDTRKSPASSFTERALREDADVAKFIRDRHTESPAPMVYSNTSTRGRVRHVLNGVSDVTADPSVFSVLTGSIRYVSQISGVSGSRTNNMSG